MDFDLTVDTTMNTDTIMLIALAIVIAGVLIILLAKLANRAIPNKQ